VAERWRGRVGGLRDRDLARTPTSRVAALGVFGRSGVGWFVVIDYANRDGGGGAALGPTPGRAAECPVGWRCLAALGSDARWRQSQRRAAEAPALAWAECEQCLAPEPRLTATG